MGYYFEHQEEIDLEITQELDQIQVSMTRIAKSPFYTVWYRDWEKIGRAHV